MLDNRGSTVCTYIHTHVQPVFLAQMSYKYQETSTLILENTPYKENLRKAIKCGSSRGGGDATSETSPCCVPASPKPP